MLGEDFRKPLWVADRGAGHHDQSPALQQGCEHLADRVDKTKSGLEDAALFVVCEWEDAPLPLKPVQHRSVRQAHAFWGASATRRVQHGS